MKKTKTLRNLLISTSLGLIVFVLCATHINLKGRENGGPNFFTDRTYNYTYKLGFPTPWLSKYYSVPEAELSQYDQGKTPPSKYLIYTDKSYPVLGSQLIIGGAIVSTSAFLQHPV